MRYQFTRREMQLATITQRNVNQSNKTALFNHYNVFLKKKKYSNPKLQRAFTSTESCSVKF